MKLKETQSEVLQKILSSPRKQQASLRAENARLEEAMGELLPEVSAHMRQHSAGGEHHYIRNVLAGSFLC